MRRSQVDNPKLLDFQQEILGLYSNKYSNDDEAEYACRVSRNGTHLMESSLAA